VRSLLNKDDDEKGSSHENRPNEPASDKTRDHAEKRRRDAVSGKDNPEGDGAAEGGRNARDVKESHMIGIRVSA
jgi:hypothetical protein